MEWFHTLMTFVVGTLIICGLIWFLGSLIVTIRDWSIREKQKKEGVPCPWCEAMLPYEVYYSAPTYVHLEDGVWRHTDFVLAEEDPHYEEDWVKKQLWYHKEDCEWTMKLRNETRGSDN